MSTIRDEFIKNLNEDVKTSKEREDVRVKLTDLQYKHLVGLSLEAGFKNAGELLQAFVGDLTGYHKNGSDESMIADNWYDRAFGIWVQTRAYFRAFLFDEEYDLAALKDMDIDEDCFNEAYEEYVELNTELEHDSKEECIKIVKELIQEKELES